MIVTVVPTFNGENWIRGCLSSLARSSAQTYVIVVDNASIDNTVGMATKELEKGEVIELSSNLGFGAAVNIGIEKGLEYEAENFFVVNQDVTIGEDTVGRLKGVTLSNPDLGIVSPLHLSGNGDSLDSGFARYIGPERCPELYRDLLIRKVQCLGDVYQVAFVNAAAWFLPVNTIELVGGFNPLFFLYGEDVDYVNRVKFHGLKVGLNPNVSIRHDREGRVNQYKDKVIKSRMRLVKWLDITAEFDVDKVKCRYRRKIRRNRLSGCLSEARRLKREYKEFLELEAEIVSARGRTSRVGRTFLDA